MMNSVEFTKFLNELRAEYDLPLLPSEELVDCEDFFTKEELASFQQEDMHL